MDAQILMPKFV